MRAAQRRRTNSKGLSGAQPLSPRRKWQTITLATLLLAPAFWFLLAGLVALASDDQEPGPDPVAALAFGVAVVPFVYIVLAFGSEHPRAPTAVLRAMGLTLLVGVPVSALAADAVTGMVAAVGAGGIAALRADLNHGMRARWAALGMVCLFVFVVVRIAGALVLLPAPALPLVAVGIADHFSELRAA